MLSSFVIVPVEEAGVPARVGPLLVDKSHVKVSSASTLVSRCRADA